MKGLKKLLTGILAATLVMGSSITVCAQDVTPEGVSGSATITVSNAAKGETYAIYKLFDATVGAGGSIAYTLDGEIPAAVADYFEKDGAGNITAKEAAFKDDKKIELSEDARNALKTWAESADALASVESDGSELTFKSLPYGYYVVTTTQGDQAITVSSTNPNAELVDKNTSTPELLGKVVDKAEAYIGDVVNYTVTFKTTNYAVDNKTNVEEQVLTYYIKDTLPDFLADTAVDSIVIDADGDFNTDEDQVIVTEQFDNEKMITIPWVVDPDTDRTSLYKNGSIVAIKYHGTVTEEAVIAGKDGNVNTVEWGYNGAPKDEATASFKTYAIAIKKVDQAGNALAGAKFEFPFAVKKDANGNPVTLEDGSYVYAGQGNTVLETTKDNGAVIVVRGLVSGNDIYVEETQAPDGYNKIENSVKITPTQTEETTTRKTWYLDEKGNVVEGSVTTTTTKVEYNNDIAVEVVLVVNKPGSLLPSTGGIGTTIFYIIGGILIVAGVAYFIVRRKANAQ